MTLSSFALLATLLCTIAEARTEAPNIPAGLDSVQTYFTSVPQHISDCPPCFNCNVDGFDCLQYANCTKSSGRCACPTGFGGPDCAEPTCGSLARGPDRLPRTAATCECDQGWTGINCNVCLEDSVCQKVVGTSQKENAICYKGADAVNENFQMCDITNSKILDTLKDKSPQATFSCNVARKECNFQFWVDQQESFYCTLDGCDVSTTASKGGNETTYRCDKLRCRCIPGRMLCGAEHSIDITDFLNYEIRGPAKFVSKRQGSNLDSDRSIFSEPAMDGLISTVFGDESIFLKCRSGECVSRLDIPGHDQPVKSINLAVVFGAIAAGLLLITALGALVFFLGRRNLQQAKYKAITMTEEDEDEIGKLLDNHKPALMFFENFSYSLSGRPILSNVCGTARPGELVAIMGASGAGKTSLLDILARKNKRGRVEGTFLLNGQDIADNVFQKAVGFVDQDDTMLPTLTVHETILDSALLRLPRAMSNAAKMQRVEDVEKQLGIFDIRHQLIGSEEGAGRGISGGEKRRVAIACELVTSPSILFLDEPTSGLDAYNAYNVVDCLTTLAKTYGRTIIFTIHQPRSNIVSLFDRLILLAQGRIVYSGPFGKCQGYFNDIGFTCPPGFNLADYLVDLSMHATMDNLNSVLSVSDGDDIDTRASSLMAIKSAASLSNVSTGPQERSPDGSLAHSSSQGQTNLTQQQQQQQREHQEAALLPFKAAKGSNSSAFSPEREVYIQSGDSQAQSRQSYVHNDAVGGNLADSSMATLRRSDLDYLNFMYMNSEIAKDLKSEMGAAISAVYDAPDTAHSHPSDPDRSASMYTAHQRPRLHEQFAILSRRTWRNLYRNPLLMLTHYAIAIVLAVFIGCLFYGLTDDLAGFQNRLGFFFFILALFGFSTLTSLTVFAPERLLFVRERAKGYYSPLAYYLAKVVFDILPLRLIPPCILGCIVYPMTGLVATWEEFSKYLLFIVLFNLAAATICLFLGIVIKNQGVANLMGVLVMLFSLLFGGFLLNHETVPRSVAWLQYLSIYHFAFEGLIVNEVRYLSLVDKQYGLNIQVPGSAILSSFGFKVLALREDAIGLVVFCSGFLVLGYLALHVLLVETR